MPNKSTIQLIITGILMVVLVMLILPRKKEKDQTGAAVNLGGITIGQIMKEERQEPRGLYTRLEEEARLIQMRRSPFSQQHLNTVSGPHLRGIFWDPIKPKAIINDRIVGNGGRVKDYTVVDIMRDKVILVDQNNQEVQLELFE